MKKVILSIVLLSFLVLFSTCSSNPKVTRIDADTQTDLTGRWNDTDVRMVSNTLIEQCLGSSAVAQYIQQYSAQNNGRLPACLVGTFRNESSEHIETAIISTNMQAAIINSGKLRFVAGGDTRAEIRDERQDQQGNASEATASALGNETGANFMLTGTVRSIVEQSGNRTIRSYFVDAQLINIETNDIMWMGTNNDIKKEIVRSNYRA